MRMEVPLIGRESTQLMGADKIHNRVLPETGVGLGEEFMSYIWKKL